MEERIGLKAGEAAASAHYASLQAESALDSLSKIRDAHKESVDKMENLLAQTRMGIQRVFDYHPSTNLLNLETVTYGKGMNKNGATGSIQGADISLTDYIAVKEGDVISYQRTNAITGKREYWGYYMVCLFDADMNVNVAANNYTTMIPEGLHEITIPAGVAYVRLTLYDLTTSLEPALVNSSELIPYEEYGDAYHLKEEGYNPETMMGLLHPVQYTQQQLTEEEKAQARENIGAISGVVVDDVLNEESENPVMNKSIAKIYHTQIEPFLLPNPALSQTYYILRAKMNGGGYELIPIQEDPYMKRWVLPNLLHEVTAADEGKLMQVVNGKWALADPIGDIAAALDSVIALQQTFIGGEGA